MSREHRNIEFDQSIEEKEKSLSLRDLVDGNILTRNHAEKKVIELNHLQSEVKELRARWISTSSELVRISRQSEVRQLVNSYDLGLEENLDPPKKLIQTEE